MSTNGRDNSERIRVRCSAATESSVCDVPDWIDLIDLPLKFLVEAARRKILNCEMSNIIATRLREFESCSSAHHIVLAIRSSDDLEADRHAVRGDASANRCGRLSGQVERIRIENP